MQVSRERLLGFLFTAGTDNWLAVLRVGLGFQVTFYSLSLRNDWNYLLSGTASGLVTRNLAEALLSLESHFVPRLGWLVALATHVGLREETVLSLAWLCLVAAGCGLIVGLASRLSAILAWFFHLCVAKSGGFVSYGVDNFMTIGLFYLMLSQTDILSIGESENCNRKIRSFSGSGVGSFSFTCVSSIFSAA